MFARQQLIPLPTPDSVKAISLWQPWAILAARGPKGYETRSWSTNYRGLLLIHAAKRWTRDENELCLLEPFWSTLIGLRMASLNQMPLGCLLGVVELTAVHRTEDIDPTITTKERSFGDFTPGRFAWKLENPQPFSEPIPYRGSQGLFDVPITVIRPYLTMEVRP